MDGMFKVTEEQTMLRDLVKKFVANELMPLEKNVLERFASGQPAALNDEENARLFKQCKQLGLDYLYLGYWIRDSRKMAYKVRFRPIEGYINGQWRELPEDDTDPDKPGT